MSRMYRKRLSVDIPEKLHAELVRMAEKRNITITMYVLRALVQRIRQERLYDK